MISSSFHVDSSLKVNVIPRLEFELFYNDVEVQYITSTETSSKNFDLGSNLSLRNTERKKCKELYRLIIIF